MRPSIRMQEREQKQGLFCLAVFSQFACICKPLVQKLNSNNRVSTSFLMCLQCCAIVPVEAVRAVGCAHVHGRGKFGTSFAAPAPIQEANPAYGRNQQDGGI